MCLFHKWSKWEQRQESGIEYLTSVFDRGPTRGQGVPVTWEIQRRTCRRCGKVQQETIRR